MQLYVLFLDLVTPLALCMQKRKADQHVRWLPLPGTELYIIHSHSHRAFVSDFATSNLHLLHLPVQATLAPWLAEFRSHYWKPMSRWPCHTSQQVCQQYNCLWAVAVYVDVQPRIQLGKLCSSKGFSSSSSHSQYMSKKRLTVELERSHAKQYFNQVCSKSHENYSPEGSENSKRIDVTKFRRNLLGKICNC